MTNQPRKVRANDRGARNLVTFDWSSKTVISTKELPSTISIMDLAYTVPIWDLTMKATGSMEKPKDREPAWTLSGTSTLGTFIMICAMGTERRNTTTEKSTTETSKPMWNRGTASTTTSMGIFLKENGRRISAGERADRHTQMEVFSKGLGSKMKRMVPGNWQNLTEKRCRYSIRWENWSMSNIRVKPIKQCDKYLIIGKF